MQLLLISANASLSTRVIEILEHPTDRPEDTYECEIANSLIQALQSLNRPQGRLILLDLDVDGSRGIDACLQIKAKRPDCALVTLSETLDDPRLLESIEAGAQEAVALPEMVPSLFLRLLRAADFRQNLRRVYTSESELLENLLEHSPERIYFKDRASHFIRVNRSMATLFEQDDPANLIGRSDFDFFTGEHANQAFEDEQALVRGETPIISKVEKETFPSGDVSWVLTTKLPLMDRQGKIRGTFGISHDVTKFHEMERALEQDRNRLKELSDELLLKNRLLESDLNMAREIQQALLPHAYPFFPSQTNQPGSLLTFAHRYIPAQAVGGDFFAVFPVAERQAGVLICDVMGHGPRAAIVTAVIRWLTEELRPKAARPAELMRGLNSGLRRVLDRVDDPLLCTGLYMLIDSETGSVSYSNAGHPSPLHFMKSSQEVQAIPSQSPMKGAVLGLYDDAEYSSTDFDIERGDRLMLFTDGLYEAERNADGNEFGMENLIQISKENMDLPRELLLDQILGSVRSRCGAEFDDDVCMLLAELA